MLVRFFHSGRNKTISIIMSLVLVFVAFYTLPSADTHASTDSVLDDQPVISESYLRGVKEGITCAQLKSSFTHNYSYDLYTSEGKYINASNATHKVCTGDYIKDGLNNIYTVVVTGDIYADGVVDVTDTAAIKMHFAKSVELTDALFQAADTNNDNRITATDYLLIKYHIQMKYNIHDNESFSPDEFESSGSDNSYDESNWTSGWM